MPDSHNRSDTNYAKYDAMSTEELQQLLREDASKPEGEDTNMEVLLYVMDVLAKRRQARNEGISPEEALESFMQNYMPEDEESSDSESESTVRRFAPNVRRWMSGLIAAAAMFVVILGSSLTASALGFDLWDIIVKWTQETFQLGYVNDVSNSEEPKATNDLVYAELQAALDNYDITTVLVPSWFPAGYTAGNIQVFDTPRQRQFIALFENEEYVIKIWIADYLDSHPTQIEQSEKVVEVYSSNGVTYYIIEDNNQLRAAWIIDSFECYISGQLTLEELKMMIDSIGKADVNE